MMRLPHQNIHKTPPKKNYLSWPPTAPFRRPNPGPDCHPSLETRNKLLNSHLQCEPLFLTAINNAAKVL